MRNPFLTSLVVLAFAGGAVAQTATTPAKPMTTTKKSTAKTAAMTPAPSASAAKPAATAKPMMAAKPTTTAATTASKSAGGRKPMTAESKACSAQADAKGLHGKDREKFRRGCLKGA